MTTRSVVVVLAKIALPVLIALLWAYRRHLAKRPTPPRKDEIAFERPYERLEPQASQPDYVRGTGDFILGYHEWAWLALLLVVIAIGFFAIKEPLVRIISGITGIVLVTIIVVWAYRQRSGAKRFGR